VGIRAKKYLTLDPQQVTLEIESPLGKKAILVAQRVVLTDKLADREFVWQNDYSGK
jgi:hypothetical protein